MAKDNQTDSKHAHKEKLKGGSTMADVALDGVPSNVKKQPPDRNNPGDGKK